MSDVNLDDIFLKSEEENLDIQDNTPVVTTDDTVPEPVPVPEKPKRKKRVISEEQRAKMLENLKKGREKKKRVLNKIKQDKIEKEEQTQNELKLLRDEIMKLKASKLETIKKEPEPVEKPVEKPVEPIKPEPVKVEPKPIEDNPVIKLVPPAPPKPQPRIVYHGYDPTKRRY